MVLNIENDVAVFLGVHIKYAYDDYVSLTQKRFVISYSS